MIISASRRTDIPAFFGDWFMKRIEEGYFLRVNPYNSKQVRCFNLKPEDVEVIVFWTKNPKPFFRHLDTLDSLGFRYYFQFTVNDYPPLLEPHVPALEQRINTFRTLSERLGPNRVIWRYDPIVVSTVTPISYHLDRIEGIAKQLYGKTQRLVISFLDFYGKVQNRYKAIEKEHNITFTDILCEERTSEFHYMVRKIAEIGKCYGLEVQTCAEAIDLNSFDVQHGACIDGRLIRELFDPQYVHVKDKNQRTECLCTESVDIGMYDTCRFNCSYCYAVTSEKAVNNMLLKHHINSPALVGKYDPLEIEDLPKGKVKKKSIDKQISLFEGLLTTDSEQ